jgi:hypothetical protein
MAAALQQHSAGARPGGVTRALTQNWLIRAWIGWGKPGERLVIYVQQDATDGPSRLGALFEGAPQGELTSPRAGSTPHAGFLVRLVVMSGQRLPFGKGSIGRNAYFSELLIDVNWVLRVVPRPFTAAMIASAMPAAIRPYSIAVAPDSSDRNFKR